MDDLDGRPQPRLLLVHAHPDDETLWTGGTIATYAAQGVRVTVVTCTLGEEGEIIPPELALLTAANADQLGGYRVGELRSACAALGVTDHRFLGGIGRWRDSGMVGDPANHHPRAFINGSMNDQAAALREVITEVRPQVIATYAEDGGYGHPDHIRAHDITVAAAPEDARVFYAVTSRQELTKGIAELPDVPYRIPTPGELPAVDEATITTVIDIEAHLPAKLRALRAHATQISVWKDSAYALSNGIAQPILGHENYILASGPPDGAAADLFGGLA